MMDSYLPNMLFTWRRRYLAEQQTQSAGLIPVVLVDDTRVQVGASSSVEPQAQDTRPALAAGCARDFPAGRHSHLDRCERLGYALLCEVVGYAQLTIDTSVGSDVCLMTLRITS